MGVGLDKSTAHLFRDGKGRTVRICYAQREQTPEIFNLYRGHGMEEYTKGLGDSFNAGNHLNFVAMLDDKVVGHIGYTLGKRQVQIRRMAVANHPHILRSRIASYMMHWIKTKLTTSRCFLVAHVPERCTGLQYFLNRNRACPMRAFNVVQLEGRTGYWFAHRRPVNLTEETAA